MAERIDKANGIAKHWIGGNWRDSVEHRDSINPATGEIIGRYAVAGREETGEAVAVALKVFRETDWRANPALRSRVLNEMADRFEARATATASPRSEQHTPELQSPDHLLCRLLL